MISDEFDFFLDKVSSFPSKHDIDIQTLFQTLLRILVLLFIDLGDPLILEKVIK